ncbi:MAG: hypothetical protein RR033_03565 [Clostridia bacterium]
MKKSDYHYFDIKEGIFGRKDKNYGTVKYLGSRLLPLSNNTISRCCRFYGNTLALINNKGNRVLIEPDTE